jgi:hypothetical protein
MVSITEKTPGTSIYRIHLRKNGTRSNFGRTRAKIDVALDDYKTDCSVESNVGLIKHVRCKK